MNERIDRDAYFVLHVKMPSGFEFKIPARGFNLKSWLNFEANLGCECYYEQTNQTVYEHLVLGDPSCPLSQPADTESKTSTKPTSSSKKATTAPKKATSKASTTKRSVAPAKKAAPKKVASSTTKKKPTVGSKKKVLDK